MGSTSPVWKTPGKWIFVVVGLVDLVLFTVILILTAQDGQIQGECDQSYDILINYINAFLFLSFLLLLRISMISQGSDVQWSRYLIILSVLSAGLILMAFGMFSIQGQYPECEEDDGVTWGNAFMAALSGFVMGALQCVIIAGCVYLFYFTTRQVAYNHPFVS